MASIPKKVMDRFVQNVPKFTKVLMQAKDRDVNESDTVAILVDILSEVFGYDKYLDVTSEVAIRGTYCDLALKVEDKKQFLIEVKAIGIALKDSHMKQACDYGANEGLPWIILTNGIEWKIYKIRFEKPINFDLILSFDFLELNARKEKDQEILFILSKEGVVKESREEFHEKVKSVNRHIIGNIILAEPVMSVIRRELRKYAGGTRIETSEIEQIIRQEVLKREVLEGEEATTAHKDVAKYYRKVNSPKRKRKKVEPQTSENADENE